MVDRPAYPRRMVGLAFVLTLVVLVALGAQLWHSYRELSETLEGDFRLQELRGVILHHDEVLTMSARMAAATGDVGWEKRYRQAKPKLDDALQEAVRLAPQTFLTDAARQTDRANRRLVEMENRGFAMVRQGRGQAAWDLLNCQEYRRQKRLYAEGMEQVLAGLHDRGRANQQRYGRNAYLAVAGIAVALPVILFIWLSVIRLVRSHLASQRAAEQERLRFEEQIRHVQKLESLGILAGGIAHDFNNLLTAVQGHAELGIQSLPESSEVRCNLREILHAAARAAELSNQMLAYVGGGHVKFAPVDLNRLIGQMQELLASSISKKVALKQHLSEDLPPFEADRVQIQQIVMNLVTNAAEAIGEDEGVVTLRTGAIEATRNELAGTYLDEDLPAGRYVCLEVTDTGCGVDAETRRKLFDPFFTTKFTGRGLGLSTVLGIVRRHHGAIDVRSEPGTGSVFRVLLPFRPAGAPAKTPETPPPAAATTAATAVSRTVLVVDDEEAVRGVCRAMLEKAGFDVLTAGDGREGVQMYRDRPDEIRAVLLDMTMPRMSGAEALRELRRIRPDVKVVLASGYQERHALRQLSGAPPAAFLQKPFDSERLIDALRKLVA